ncbi:MAG TPA: hypothetical protein VGH28_10695 [Polyangiaceae bacterium]|jgi:hypothetical protein
MTFRVLFRGLVVYAVLFVCAILGGRAAARLRPPSEPTFIASRWKDGKLLGRTVTRSADGAPLDELGGTLVFEHVTGEAWLPTFSHDAASVAILTAREGVRVDLDGKTAYVTPDELLARQAYDKGVTIDSIGLTLGTDFPVVVAIAAEHLGKNPIDVQEHATMHRIRTERIVPGRLPERPLDAASFDDADAERFVLGAARYLARGVGDNGRFRYLVDAPTNRDLSGYDWPRHAGATYFLAQAAEYAKRAGAPDAADLGSAALRAANLLRGAALARCGSHQCIGDGDPLDIGSIALTTIAFAEIVSSDLDKSFEPLVRSLASTILWLQRPDGEFMHQVHRDGSAIDVQLPYFSGESALALARANALTNDASYLDGARRSVAYLIGPAWHFFGDRYYFAEEHWTCQAASELQDRAGNAAAIDFCLRWQDFNRGVQLHAGDSELDCDGALGVGPIVTPRYTPVASRCEAGIATLDAAIKTHTNAAEISALRDQIRRSLALLARQQFHGQLEHLMADPEAVRGAMPGSEVDWQLRIDYAQHAGSTMLRWLALPRSTKVGP